MALRLTHHIVRGEIDNTVRGRVRGTLWLTGWDQPLVLDLEGDCWRDLAGCTCSFENPLPLEGAPDGIHPRQTGRVGDMTASRKVRLREGPPSDTSPEPSANALYLEWFSERNGRVVIESPQFTLSVSLPEWTMTDEEEQAQRTRNEQAMGTFLETIERALRPAQPVDVPEDREMDEFEWERFMKESDARTERYGELLEKYMDHPDRDKLVAEAMGWNRPAEGPGFEIPDDIDWDVPEPEPDPVREGIDWIRTEDGDIVHPLQHRCHELGIRIHHDTKRTYGDNDADPDLHELEFKVHCTSAKLAGALNSLGIADYAPEAGFIIARLKRALALLNEGLAAYLRLAEKPDLPHPLPDYREDLFEMRDAILRLMETYRQ